jgi:hypothetical protein
VLAAFALLIAAIFGPGRGRLKGNVVAEEWVSTSSGGASMISEGAGRTRPVGATPRGAFVNGPGRQLVSTQKKAKRVDRDAQEKRARKAAKAAAARERRERQRAALQQWYDQLQTESSDRLTTLMGTTAEEASGVVAALRDLLDEAERAAAEVHEDVLSQRERLRSQVTPLLDDAAHLDDVIEVARAAAESTAADVEIQRAQLLAEASSHHQQLTGELDDLVGRSRARVEQRVEEMEALVAEALEADCSGELERQRDRFVACVDELLVGASEAAASVSSVAGAARAEVEDARAVVEGAVREFEVLRADCVGEWEHERQRFADAGALALEEHAAMWAVGVARIGTADEEIRSAETRVLAAADELEARFETIERQLAARVTALMSEAEAGAGTLAERRAAVEADIGVFATEARRALEMVADLEQSFHEVGGYAADAQAIVAELSETARAALAEVPEDADGFERGNAEGDAESAGGSAEETSAGVGAPDGPLALEADGWSTGEPPNDDFFAQIADELRADPESDVMPVGSHDDRGGSAPVVSWSAGAASPSVPHAVDVLEVPPAPALQVAAAVATIPAEAGPITLSVPVASLASCIEHLASSASTSALVRLEVGASVMRLVVHDPGGWWDYTEVPVIRDRASDRSLVVDVHELRDAVSDLERFSAGPDVAIVMDHDVTLGSYLLLSHDDTAELALPKAGVPVEKLDLRANRGNGAVIETQLGRLFLSPGLLAHLRMLNVAEAELVLIDGQPHVTASALGTAVRVVAHTHELGEGDEPVLSERRRGAGDEVAQLKSALSPNTTSDELEHILKSGVGYIRRRAAAHPALAPEMIESLVTEGTEAMRAAAASNASIPPDVADVAARDESAVVRSALASNPSIPDELAQRLRGDATAQVRAHLGTNAVVAHEILEQLANDEDSTVRSAVASNPNARVETLFLLARDPDGNVCSAVAGNPSCPDELLDELVSVAPNVVLANPNASPALLLAGAEVESPAFRAAIAQNPAAPAKALRKLAHDPDMDVLRAVAEHPAAPASVRRRARRGLESNRPGLRWR